MNTYAVTVTAKFPAAGSRNCDELSISAKDSKDAISKARREMARSGWTRQDGPLSYKATKENE